MPPAAGSPDARRLAVVLELLTLLGLFSGAFPLAVSSPIWWLRLGDSLINLAPVLLLAVILLRFASLYLNPDDDDDWLSLTRQTVQLASRWAPGVRPAGAAAIDQLWLALVRQRRQTH